MRLLSLLLFISMLLLPISAAGALVGGWRPILDVADPHVVEIGQYAVSEYDRRSQADLKFERVLRGETQVVAGTNYRLLIQATKGGSGPSKSYEAIVWEKPWQKFRNLTSFKPASGKIH